MDRFQTAILEAIQKRRSGSFKNHVTVFNSTHSGNDFTSQVIVQDKVIAEIVYSQKFFDFTRGEIQQVEEIIVNEDAIQDCLGTQARRVVNFLNKALLV